MDRNTLGIYVQVPFCQTKCTYCNFHTGVVARSLYRPYVDAVCREIRESRALRGVTADTVYLGGGTPSLLEPADLRCIMDTIRQNYSCALEEVTLEADPETITAEKAEAWLDAGFNRRVAASNPRDLGIIGGRIGCDAAGARFHLS